MNSHSRPAAPKPDNLLGICHAIGQVFGIDPLYLRLAVLAAMLANFQVAAIIYLLAGVAVGVVALMDRVSASKVLPRSDASPHRV